MFTQEFVKSVFDYNSETGIFIWKVRRSQSTKAGSVAGTKDSFGHIQIRIGEKQNNTRRKVCAHQLAWLYFYGEWPKFPIDHINGNPSDNRITNLRYATTSQNNSNARLYTNNSSGIKGVHFNK